MNSLHELCLQVLGYSRSHLQVGSLEVDSCHAAPIRAPLSPLDRIGVV